MMREEMEEYEGGGWTHKIGRWGKPVSTVMGALR